MGKKKHTYITCFKCRNKNDLDEMIENKDYDRDNHREGVIYIYCCECGQQIEVKLNK